jgi:L-seryl-tRNA(Ser) seleniumtransferase
MPSHDRRRAVPRTDRVLADPVLEPLLATVHPDVLRGWVRAAQECVRIGTLHPDDLPAAVLARSRPSLGRVINGTGVIVHTNLGRAPLSVRAQESIGFAVGCTPVELDLSTGRRGPRAPGVVEALLARVGPAESAHVVGNGAAAVLLVVTALAAGKEVIVSRGELVEIGDGFRLPELLETTGARLREVGTTNRTRLEDYSRALSPETGCILKVHPSNFRMDGFVGAVPVAELSTLGLPLVVDVGSGLLGPHPLLPDEPDMTTSLSAGADVVTCSGDKLLGGPQAGLIVGRAAVVERARRHPLARALRPGKLTLSALEATLRAPSSPVADMLATDVEALTARAQPIAAAALAAVGTAAADAVVVGPCRSVVGGGGAPGVTLDSVGLSLPERLAGRLREGDPPVLTRVTEGRCVLDLRTVAPEDDETLTAVLVSALRGE